MLLLLYVLFLGASGKSSNSTLKLTFFPCYEQDQWLRLSNCKKLKNIMQVQKINFCSIPRQADGALARIMLSVIGLKKLAGQVITKLIFGLHAILGNLLLFWDWWINNLMDRLDAGLGRVILCASRKTSPSPFHTAMTGKNTGEWNTWEGVLLLLFSYLYTVFYRVLLDLITSR